MNKKITTVILVSVYVLLSLASCQRNTKDQKVCISPMQFEETSTISVVKSTIEEIYEMEVTILGPSKLPQEAFVNTKSPRYRADKLIAYLKKHKPDSINYILGLTSKDISTTKRGPLGKIKKPISRYKDWGIFGLGYRPGPSCIVSTFRIKSSSKKSLNRLRKICIHEIGHNLGLKHCPDKKCVMTDACESIKTVDNVKLQLCKNYKHQI